ncbi:MAG: hypothetical protein QM499_03510 [Flavobacteriaceae bacterium]
MRFFLQFTILLLSFSIIAQVGIGTTSPEGALDIVTSNDTGLIIPRVSSIENVTDGNGNDPVNGTIVYDLSRGTTCFYTNDKWLCMDTDNNGDPVLTDESTFQVYNNTGTYFKASNTGDTDRFGASVSMSNDGNTIVFGATQEDSNATGINGNESDNSISNSGAVYVFYRNNGVWVQQAYIKASNPGALDAFGNTLNLSGDGNTLVVGSSYEDSSATGINGDQTNNSATNSGAVYVFTRSSGVWTQQAYIKASNTQSNDNFSVDVFLSNNGNILAVSANGEGSNATGINGDQTNNSASYSGAVYIFTRSGSTWSQQAYIKASNSEAGDLFGDDVSLSGDGNTLVVSARDDSSATGINGDQTNNSASVSGAVYVFTRNGSVWVQQAYIKASNAEAGDFFGTSVSLNSNGNILAVGANNEDSNATGENGNQGDNSFSSAGAVYIFKRTGSTWVQETYLKSSNTGAGDTFGVSVYLSNNGLALAVGAQSEDSNATGINGDEVNNSSLGSGAAYVYLYDGSNWVKQVYLKATNTDAGDLLGREVSLSANGSKFVTIAWQEGSNATGIGGDETNNSFSDAGAGYFYEN